jgi:hypothetical protein
MSYKEVINDIWYLANYIPFHCIQFIEPLSVLQNVITCNKLNSTRRMTA